MNKDLSYEEMYEKFYEIYYSKIVPKLGELEQVRVECLRKMKFEILGTRIYLIMFLLIALLFKVNGHCDDNAFYSSFVIGLFALFFSNQSDKHIKAFKNSLKIKMFPFLLGELGDVEYSPNSKILKRCSQDLKKYKIFRNALVSYDDVFHGERRNIKFNIMESEELWNRHVFVFLDLNKFIKNNVVIANKQSLLPEWSRILFYVVLRQELFFTFLLFVIIIILIFVMMSYELLGLLMSILIGLFCCLFPILSMLSSQIIFNGLKKIELEDVEFNEKYMLYSDDEVEARYLATPAFMERLKNLELAFCAKKIKVSCRGNKILFAIESRKDLFEFVDINKPLNNPEQFKKFFDQISSVLLMIDHFKLDEKTGL